MAKKLRLEWWDKSQTTKDAKHQIFEFEDVTDALQFLLSVVDSMSDEAPWKDKMERGSDDIWRPKL